MSQKHQLYQRVKQIVNLLKAEKVTAYRIYRDTDYKVPELTLHALKNDKAQIKNIYFTTALSLLDWYDEHYEDYK